MTQQEFEDRTGLKVTSGEYADIEDMYMSADNMEKDEFCKCWRQAGKNPLTLALSRSADKLSTRICMMAEELEREQSTKKGLAGLLLEKAQQYRDPDFRREAVKLLGELEVVRMKIEWHMELWEEDSRFLLSIMDEYKG